MCGVARRKRPSRRGKAASEQARQQAGLSWSLDRLSDTFAREWDKTYSCYITVRQCLMSGKNGSRQPLTSSSESVLCLVRIVHATFPSDSTHCLTVTSKSVCCATVPSGGREGFTPSTLTVTACPIPLWTGIHTPYLKTLRLETRLSDGGARITKCQNY